MHKIISLVYQDCPDCGSRKEWADDQHAIAAKNGFRIEKLSFVMPESKDLMLAAKNKFGIKSMPFFTDGKKFSKTLEDFVEKPKAKKAKKKSAKPETPTEIAEETVMEDKSDGISAEA